MYPCTPQRDETSFLNASTPSPTKLIGKTPSSMSSTAEANREQRRLMLQQRCMHRARLSRERRLQVAREIGCGAKTKEAAVEAVKQEFSNWDGNIDDENNIYLLEEEITKQVVEELLKEEEFCLLELEREERQKQLDVEHFLKLEQLPRNGPMVLCPLCTENYLSLTESIIHCECGLRINAQGEISTLEHLQNKLAATLQCHSYCSNKLDFHIQTQFGPNLLACRCIKCSFYSLLC